MESRAQPGGFRPLASLAGRIEPDAPATRATAPVEVSPGRVGRVLGVIIALLVVLNLAAQATGIGTRTLVLDTEQSVPTYFSTLILVAAAGLLAVIATLKHRARDGYRLHWAALSLVFLYLSMDELIGIHEMSSSRVERVVETGGIFHYASTVFTSLLVVLVGLTFLRFFLHLSPRFRALFAVSAGLYVGGALIMEMVGAMFDARFGAENTGYFLITTVEETMEMTGVAIFIYSLLEYLRARFRGAALRFGPAE